MKKINTLTIMILLTYSFLISQELEVEGDLKVTGTVESTTIDSMQQLIDGLQVQINAMYANGLQSQLITLENIPIGDEYEYYYIYLDELIGSHHDWYKFSIVDANFNLSSPYNGTTPAVEARAHPDINDDGNINNTFSPAGEFFSFYVVANGIEFSPQLSSIVSLAGLNPAFRFQNNGDFNASYGEGSTMDIILLIHYQE